MIPGTASSIKYSKSLIYCVNRYFLIFGVSQVQSLIDAGTNGFDTGIIKLVEINHSLFARGSAFSPWFPRPGTQNGFQREPWQSPTPRRASAWCICTLADIASGMNIICTAGVIAVRPGIKNFAAIPPDVLHEPLKRKFFHIAIRMIHSI